MVLNLKGITFSGRLGPFLPYLQKTTVYLDMYFSLKVEIPLVLSFYTNSSQISTKKPRNLIFLNPLIHYWQKQSLQMFLKIGVLKISPYSHENTCVGFSF